MSQPASPIEADTPLVPVSNDHDDVQLEKPVAVAVKQDGGSSLGVSLLRITFDLAGGA